MNTANKATAQTSPVKKPAASNPVKKTAVPSPVKKTTISPAKPKKTTAAKEEKKTPNDEKKEPEQPEQPENSELKAILDSIDFKEIDYIRALPNPPRVIIDISKAIFQLTNGGLFDWTSFRESHLKGKKTLHRALNINFSAVDIKNVEEAKKILAEGEVTEELISRVSKVCVLLFKWVNAAIALIESRPDSSPEVVNENSESASEKL